MNEDLIEACKEIKKAKEYKLGKHHKINAIIVGSKKDE
jgi:hypothetical protein